MIRLFSFYFINFFSPFISLSSHYAGTNVFSSTIPVIQKIRSLFFFSAETDMARVVDLIRKYFHADVKSSIKNLLIPIYAVYIVLALTTNHNAPLTFIDMLMALVMMKTPGWMNAFLISNQLFFLHI